MTLRKSQVVILSEAKNLNSLRTHRELLVVWERKGWRKLLRFFASLRMTTGDFRNVILKES